MPVPGAPRRAVSSDGRPGLVRVRGLPYAYEEWGAGELVLFGHGTFGAKEMFRPQLERLSRTHRCVAFDWPGHGGSGHDPAGWGVDDLVADVPELIHALGARRAHLAGVSQGGAVFLRTAIAHPEAVASLTVMCAGTGPPPTAALDGLRQFARRIARLPDGPERRASAASFLAGFHAPGFTERRPGAARQEVDLLLAHPRTALELLVEVPAGYVPVDDRLGLVGCPTLVIWGEHDMRPAFGAVLAASVESARLVEVAGAGHHVHIDEPDAVSDALATFLAATGS